MKRMIALALTAVAAAGFVVQGADGSKEARLQVYFFTSGVCPICKQAGRELPAMLRRYPRLELRTYEVRDAQNRVTDLHRRNMGTLMRLLQAIQLRTKGAPFIYERRTAYPFVAVRGVPYYEKKLSATTTVKKEVPVPVFILGDRVYVGYQQEILSQALGRYGGGK